MGGSKRLDQYKLPGMPYSIRDCLWRPGRAYECPQGHSYFIYVVIGRFLAALCMQLGLMPGLMFCDMALAMKGQTKTTGADQFFQTLSVGSLLASIDNLALQLKFKKRLQRPVKVSNSGASGGGPVGPESPV